MNGITVVIPTIPERQWLLGRALESVWQQTLPPAAVVIARAARDEPASSTRDRGLAMVQTDLVAFLDDDDEFYPEHLEVLLTGMTESDADLVFSWFDVIGGTDPFPQFFGMPWDDREPRQTTVTTLGRTAALRDAGGFGGGWDPARDPGVDADGHRAGEDFHLVLRLIDAHARIVHVPRRTWAWHHDSGNTSGLPSRRRALV